jgi:glycosyltransferase involved in cell wall biosynthesis
MKILFLTYEVYEGGGNFIRAFCVAKALAAQGHEVSLVCASRGVALLPTIHRHGRLTIVESPDIAPRIVRHDGVGIMDLFFRLGFVVRSSYDFVHGFGHRPTVSLPSLFFRLIHRRSYVADWSDLWGKEGIAQYRHGALGRLVAALDTWLEPWVYTQASAITVISQFLFHRAGNLGFDKNRIFLLPAGASPGHIRPQDKAWARKKVGIPLLTPLVVYVGYTTHDLVLLARTLKALVKINPRVRLLLIGRSTMEFKKYIESHGLSPFVIYAGAVPHEKLNTYLSCGDVMLLPYPNTIINRARFPNKFGEYLSAGRPVVTSPTGDMERFYKKSLVGALCSSSPQATARAIQRLLLNKNQQRILGKNARALAETTLSWKKIAPSLSSWYQSLIL